MSKDWNNEATKLAKHLKVESGLKWSDLAEKISQATPDHELTTQSLANAVNRGNYNVRLLLRMCDAAGLEVALVKKKEG